MFQQQASFGENQGAKDLRPCFYILYGKIIDWQKVNLFFLYVCLFYLVTIGR